MLRGSNTKKNSVRGDNFCKKKYFVKQGRNKRYCALSCAIHLISMLQNKNKKKLMWVSLKDRRKKLIRTNPKGFSIEKYTNSYKLSRLEI